MISKILIIVFFGLNALAGANFTVKGKVTKVDHGIAIVKSKSGETRIPMKRLSKADAKTVNLGTGSKKEIQLRVPAHVLKK